MTKWDIGQVVSGICVIIGVAIEIVMRAHLGFVLITLGGLGWGIFTKFKGR